MNRAELAITGSFFRTLTDFIFIGLLGLGGFNTVLSIGYTPSYYPCKQLIFCPLSSSHEFLCWSSADNLVPSMITVCKVHTARILQPKVV